MVETSKSGSMSGEREWMPAHLAHRSCTSLRLYHLDEISRADPEDDLIDLLSEEDVAAWYANPHPANP